MGIRSLNRWQAFAGHFGFSLVLGLAVFVLFRFVWYPDALFILAGAGTLMLLVVGIDVVMGPLLTLIVFNPVKKSLLFDLAVILALQLAALGYGIWVMAQSRPVFLVGVVDRFELVAANEIHPDDLKKASRKEWQSLSWNGPELVGAKSPADPEERMAQAMDAARGGPDLPRIPKYFVPIDTVSRELIGRGRALASYESYRPAEVATARQRIAARGVKESETVVLPLKARLGMGAIVVERGAGNPLISLAFDGYETAVEKPQEPAEKATKP